MHANPLIRQCMALYHKEIHGKVNLSNILSGANKEMKDIPVLEEFIDNKRRSILCINWCLGVCSYAMRIKCKFIRGHVPKEKTSNKFARKLCQVISSGVKHVLKHGLSGLGPPFKKPKLRGNPQLLGVLGNVV